MSLLLKDPNAALDYAVDWGAEYLDGQTLSGSQWQVTPVEIGGLSVTATSFDETVASVTATGANRRDRSNLGGRKADPKR